MEEVSLCLCVMGHTSILMCAHVHVSVPVCKIQNLCKFIELVLFCICVCVSHVHVCVFWHAFVSERKCFSVFQVREFPCSLTRCDSYNWVPFDFCRLAPQPTILPLLLHHFLSSSWEWRELLGLCCCDLWVLSAPPFCCLSSDPNCLIFSCTFTLLCFLSLCHCWQQTIPFG